LISREQGPVSLGIVQPDRPAVIPAARLPGLQAGQLFEITVEPYGGSPINRPTGAILYKVLTVQTY
jgi:anti-sigma-K factor RskA